MSPFQLPPIHIMGYGRQGQAQARLLRAKGLPVTVVSTSERPSTRLARADGFEVQNLEQALEGPAVLVFLLPDEVHHPVLGQEVLPRLREGQTLILAHGYALCFDPLPLPGGPDILLMAPKMTGERLLRAVPHGGTVPVATTVVQNPSGRAQDTLTAYGRAAFGPAWTPIPVTAEQETLVNLFSEMALFCGGLPALLAAGVQHLEAQGIPAPLTYAEGVAKLDLLGELLLREGQEGMLDRISPTAARAGRYGLNALLPLLQPRMAELWAHLSSGAFHRERREALDPQTAQALHRWQELWEHLGRN